jgi:predicted SAM-dependent methyltransferase
MEERMKYKKLIKGIIPPFLILLRRVNIDLIRTKRKESKNNRKLITVVNKKVDSGHPVQIELGSNIKREGWITIDISDGADINIDLTLPIPLNDKMIDIIYTSHLLEHFSYKDLIELMNELLRILKPGGILKISVPDARIFIDAYESNDQVMINELSKTNHFKHPFTRIDFINYIAFMGGAHKYMFEMGNLKAILSYVGFKEVLNREFEPELDLEVRKEESIFVLAIK